MRLNDVDALIASRIDAHGPGVAAAIVRDGEVIYERGHGLANLEWDVPIAVDTVLGLGSLTKPFTAQAVMLLELAGKLRIADAVAAYLPDLPWLDPRVTIMHLLTHTSGIANYITQPGFWEHVSKRAYTLAEHIAHIGTLQPAFAPGERYGYSNSGYALLGLLIERVAGVPYDDYLRTAIFEPLGMQDTRFLWDEPVVPRLAGRYEPAKPGGRVSGYERAPYLSAIFTYANGGLVSTVRDLVRWDAALREHQLLPAEAEVRMQQPVTLNDGRSMGYGLGWGLSHYRGHAAVHHAGGVLGYSAFLGRFVEDGLTIIALSNLGGFDGSGLAAEIATSVLDLPAPEGIPVDVPPEQLAAAEGIYTSLVHERLEVVRAGERLELRGTRHGPLIPLGNDTFLLAGNADMTVRFEALKDGKYARATAVVPLYWFEVERMAE
jgi:CubicO group peptidase (beta-lactamase class C family)